MLKVVEINAIEHLEAIRLRWTSLLNETRGSSFFHSLDWLQVYWRHFRYGQRLRVLLVFRGGTVLGILPLVVRHEETAVGSVEVLTYPTIDPVRFFGPLGPNPTATLMASFRHLAGEARDWDLLSLTDIGEHDHGRTANALELAGFCPHEVVHTTASKICFDASWLNDHCERSAEIADGMSFERIRPLGNAYGDDRPLEPLVEECFSLDLQSPLSGFTSTTSLAFLQDIVRAASRLGMLDLNLLRLESRLIAFSVNAHLDGTMQQLCAGQASGSYTFDAADVLTRRMLHDSVARNDRRIYLHQSNERVPNRWAIQQLPVLRYQHRVAFPYRTRLALVGNWLLSR